MGAGCRACGASPKVGVINIQAAIASTAEGKQAAAELQSQFAPRTNELQNLQKQIEDLRDRLQTGQSTLSDEEKARLSREGDQLTRTFQRKQQELQDDTNDAQQDVVNRIGRKLVDVLNKYAKDNCTRSSWMTPRSRLPCSMQRTRLTSRRISFVSTIRAIR